MSATPLTASALFGRACVGFDGVLRLVKTEQWAAPTPCVSWSVRELVQHVVSELRWMPPLLAGRTVAEVGDELAGDLLGADPVRAWESALSAAQAAVAHADGRDSGGDGGGDGDAREVELSAGPTAVPEYLRQVAADLLVHSWDLAVAVGASTLLDPDAVAAVGGWFVAHEATYRAAGAVGPRPTIAHDGDPQSRLLAMFGRAEGTDSLDVVKRFGAAFDAQDVDAIMSLMTADCVFESTRPPDGERHQGQAQVRAVWVQLFASAEGMHFDTESMFSCGDRVVTQWRYTWSGQTPQTAGHIRGIDVFRLRDGLVAEKVSYVKG